MSERIALFASKDEIEDFFQCQTERVSIFEPHYNIAPAQHIAIIISEDDELSIGRARWGLGEGDDQSRHTISKEDAVAGIKNRTLKRCIIPVSGFYKWKSAGKRADHPFFIRMLNESVMPLAGVLLTETSDEGRDRRSCAIINTEANALIQPLDPFMPLQLDRELSKQWLDGTTDAEGIIEEAEQLFLLTEMSALRVSKKVNDLSQNSPALIQPLPK
jgi:putative SOS response-associated peptidase YedK